MGCEAAPAFKGNSEGPAALIAAFGSGYRVCDDFCADWLLGCSDFVVTLRDLFQAQAGFPP